MIYYTVGIICPHPLIGIATLKYVSAQSKRGQIPIDSKQYLAKGYKVQKHSLSYQRWEVV